jgi:hypothetical protein
MGVFSSHGKKRSSKQLSSHHHFADLELGLDFSSGKWRSDMTKKKPRSASGQYYLEIFTRLCGIGGVNFLYPINLLGYRSAKKMSSFHLKLT